MRTVLITITMTALTVSACAREEPAGPEGDPPAPTRTEAVTPATETAPADPIAAALANPRRPEGDRETDQRRKPGEVLAFFGIEPGMKVLDMYSGSGYYAEIVSYVVGNKGVVWAHNNTPYANWLSEAIEQRYAGARLQNVMYFVSENNELELPEEKFDAALMILCYHDVYHVDEANGWSKIDGPKMLAEIYSAMKPGAVLGVVDHVAEAGAPPETGETLHRIDPALARKEIEAAGFVFEAESDVLRNPDDVLTQHAFAEQIRGRTDRFVFRFRRPARANDAG